VHQAQPLRAPLLVFGGPYSNLRALAAMRARAAALGIDAAHSICTGDLVAYCAEPQETVAAIRAWGCHVIAGNCEEQLALDADHCGCGFAEDTACYQSAKSWYAFARARVSADDRRWMAGLPRYLTFDMAGWTVRVIHGSNRFVFASQRALISEELRTAKAGIVIAGHAGVPFIANFARHVWFNPGVIGMPANDGTPEVWYGHITLEDGALVLSVRRLGYDHRAAAAATRQAGHADGYAEALISGLWPGVDVLPEREKAATGQAIAEQALRLASRPLVRAASSPLTRQPSLAKRGTIK
jgi:predicted phosphodiesterase